VSTRRTQGLSVTNSVLPYEEIKGFAPRERDTYIQNVILRVLETNKKGVTVSEVSNKTNFSRPTVAKHLDILVAIGEAYKVERGNLAIYYKNGKVVHEVDVAGISTPDRTYTFYVLENEEGEFLYIQEKALDEFRSVKVRGGIMINLRDLPSVVKMADEISRKRTQS
jgi:hypothetical protein